MVLFATLRYKAHAVVRGWKRDLVVLPPVMSGYAVAYALAADGDTGDTAVLLNVYVLFGVAFLLSLTRVLAMRDAVADPKTAKHRGTLLVIMAYIPLTMLFHAIGLLATGTGGSATRYLLIAHAVVNAVASVIMGAAMWAETREGPLTFYSLSGMPVPRHLSEMYRTAEAAGLLPGPGRAAFAERPSMVSPADALDIVESHIHDGVGTVGATKARVHDTLAMAVTGVVKTRAEFLRDATTTGLEDATVWALRAAIPDWDGELVRRGGATFDHGEKGHEATDVANLQAARAAAAAFVERAQQAAWLRVLLTCAIGIEALLLIIVTATITSGTLVVYSLSMVTTVMALVVSDAYLSGRYSSGARQVYYAWIAWGLVLLMARSLTSILMNRSTDITTVFVGIFGGLVLLLEQLVVVHTATALSPNDARTRAQGAAALLDSVWALVSAGAIEMVTVDEADVVVRLLSTLVRRWAEGFYVKGIPSRLTTNDDDMVIAAERFFIGSTRTVLLSRAPLILESPPAPSRPSAERPPTGSGVLGAVRSSPVERQVPPTVEDDIEGDTEDDVDTESQPILPADPVSTASTEQQQQQQQQQQVVTAAESSDAVGTSIPDGVVGTGVVGDENV